MLSLITSTFRGPKSTEAYRRIGGGSPIVKYTTKQAALIQQSLHKRDFKQARCYFAMRYWNPYTEETLVQIQKDEIEALVIVPLYPQYSISTSGSSLKVLRDIFEKSYNIWGVDKFTHTVVPSWYHRSGYIKVMAKLIIEKIKCYSAEELHQEGVHVLFSAHGVPVSYIAAGDPYQQHIEDCVDRIAGEVSKQLFHENSSFSSSAVTITGLKLPRTVRCAQYCASNISDATTIQYHLSYQSKVGPVEWLTPATDVTVRQLGQDGVRNLIVVPVSFVSEHIETLEEIDMEYKDLAIESGIKHWERVPALNSDEDFIEDMADLVVSKTLLYIFI